jgi:glycosyltransferase involved in cell wall biosynthesis
VRKRHPDLSLIVVGEKPSHVAPEPGLEFVGFLRKEVPREVEQFRRILGRVRALVHPTRSDISPLLVIEAGYFGCPAISSRSFAVPELVDHARTGILLDDPSSVEAVVDAMSWILERTDEYEKMRKGAWAKAHGQYSKRRFEERLLSSLRDILGG